MDLPPPPPFYQQNRHLIRYGNYIHPLDLAPLSSPHHLLLPPPPPIILLPPSSPPPLPPPRHIPHHFAFSPPQFYNFDELPKPYYGRMNYDYSEQNSILEDISYHSGFIDNSIDRSPEDFPYGRYEDMFYRDPELCKYWEDELYNKRSYDPIRDYGMNRDADMRSWDLSRFTGRLGRRVDDEDIYRDRKKRRVQKKRIIDKIELEQSHRRRDGGYHCQGSGFEEKENVSLERRMKDRKEKEQSPMELDISFKSNALVAKSIFPHCNQASKSDMDLQHWDKINGEVNTIDGSSSSKSSENIVKTVISTGVVDIQSNVHQILEEPVETSTVFGNQSLNSEGENAAGNVTLEDICGSPSAKSNENMVLGISMRELDIQYNEHVPSEQLLKEPTVVVNLNVTNDGSNYLGENASENGTLEDIHGFPSEKLNENMVKTEISILGSDFQSDVLVISEDLLLKSMILGNQRGTIDDAIDLTFEDICGSPSAKSSNNIVKTKILTTWSNIQPDVPEISEELLDKSIASCNGSVTADDKSDLGENAAENGTLDDTESQTFNYGVSGGTHVRRLGEEPITEKQLLCEVSLQMTNDSCVRNEDKIAPPAVPLLNAGTSCSKIDQVPRGTVSTKAAGDSDKSLNLKRKRNNLAILPTSWHVADRMVTEDPVHTEKIVLSATIADHGCQLVISECSCRANETLLPDENIVVSLGFRRQAFNVCICVCDKASVQDPAKTTSQSSSQFSSLGTNRVGDIMDQSFHDIAGTSRPQQTENPEIHMGEYLSKLYESCPTSDAVCLLLEKSDNSAMPAVGSAYANSKEFLTNNVYVSQVGVNVAETVGVDDVAVPYSPNGSLATETNSNFLPVDRKGITSEVNVSFVETMNEQPCNDDGAKLSPEKGFVEESQEVMNDVKTCLSIDQSPGILGKRKDRDVQMNPCGLDNNEHLNTVSSNDGDPAEALAKVLISAPEVDFHGERGSFEVNDSLKGPSAIEDLYLVVDFSEGGSRKKRKVVNSSLVPSLSEDDSIAEGTTADCVELDQGSPRFQESGTGEREDMDTTLACSDMTLIQTPSFSSDENIVCAANSGDDELISSESDVPSCPSSPEDLLLFTDFSSTINPEALPSHSRNEMIYGTGETSNKRPPSAVPNTFSRKSLETANSDNTQTNAKMLPLVPQATINKVAQKSNLTYGKLALSKSPLTPVVSKVFPRIPPHLSVSRKLPSAQVTKSRTWHRSGATSVAITAPKLQSCSFPQIHTTNMSRITRNSPIAVATPKLQPRLLPQSCATETLRTTQSSYVRKGNSLVREHPPSKTCSPGFNALSSSVYRASPCVEGLKKSQSSTSTVYGVGAPNIPRIPRGNSYERLEAFPPSQQNGKSLSLGAYNMIGSLPVANSSRNGSLKTLDALNETTKSHAIPECQSGSSNNPESLSTVEGNSQKRIVYVKRRSNQLVATSDSEDKSMLGVDKTRSLLSDGYYKSRKNQLVRGSLENHTIKEDAVVGANSTRPASEALPFRSSIKRQLFKGFAKTYRSSNPSFVWKLRDALLSEKHKNAERPQKFLSRLSPWKRATYRRSFMLALGSKSNSNSFSTIRKLPFSRKRGAVYTRSTHGYSLRMSKVLSVGASSLQWSKPIEKKKKANEDATRAVAMAEKWRREENVAVPIVSKSRNNVSRKLVLSIKPRPGERIFRVGSERYKMDSTRRTLHRITEEEKPSPSIVLKSEKNFKRSYVPKRLFIGNNEYVRTGNGNKLVRDPKKRIRVLASEKVRWSLRTARLRLARTKKYCQFFTKFGKCNKDDGKCPFIHDSSKVVVCTKFLNGSCSNPDCKLTHKVIPERMQDCSYFLKGSCSNENCPYRHVNVSPDSPICESFLRGYCADGNECQKKYTYVCPAYEATGICAQVSTCKLHHPKRKTEKKLPPTSEEKSVRGRYFDGGLVDVADVSMASNENLSAKGKDDEMEGKYPDYISLDVGDDDME